MGVFDAFWLATTLRLSTPLILASSGELLAERTGVLNIGLEGFMLAGAFFGFLGTYLSGSFLVGVVFAIVAGVIFAAAMAFLSIRLNADQIVVGIGINILALGLTSFVFREVFSGPQVLLERPAPWRWPLLSDIPGVGEALFAQPGWVYVAGVVVLAVWFVLQRTTWGLSMRATGELPEAADTAGSSVFRNRWIATLVAGGLAGAGGSFLSIELGVFIEGMTNGRGYLALAAVIFGRWRAPGVLLACLLFGGADAMQLRLQAEATVPVEVWLVLALLGPRLPLDTLSLPEVPPPPRAYGCRVRHGDRSRVGGGATAIHPSGPALADLPVRADDRRSCRIHRPVVDALDPCHPL